MTNLYSCRTAGPSFSITKFDADLNPEATYHCTSAECDCPAGSRPTCKHRKMLSVFIAEGKVNTGEFLNWDTRQWLSLPAIEEAAVVPEEVWNSLPSRSQAGVLAADDWPAASRAFLSETVAPPTSVSEVPSSTTAAPAAGDGVFTGAWKRRKL